MSRVVLLVDDDPLVLDVAASMLEDIGCEVVTAAGGADALEKLSIDERSEILITDVNIRVGEIRDADTRKFEGNHTVRTRERWFRLSTYP